jgi:hypothetical protein
MARVQHDSRAQGVCTTPPAAVQTKKESTSFSISRLNGIAPLVLDFHLRVADLVSDLLGSLFSVLFDDYFFLHSRLLTHDRLFSGLLRLDRPLLQSSLARAKRTVNRMPFDMDVLVLQGHLLAYRLFDYVTPHAHPAVPDFALPDHKLLFYDRDYFLAF